MNCTHDTEELIAESRCVSKQVRFKVLPYNPCQLNSDSLHIVALMKGVP